MRGAGFACFFLAGAGRLLLLAGAVSPSSGAGAAFFAGFAFALATGFLGAAFFFAAGFFALGLDLAAFLRACAIA